MATPLAGVGGAIHAERAGTAQDPPLPEPQDYRGRGRLEGRLAVVTGPDSGIGRGIAVEFAREGASVVITYHTDAEGADQTRREVERLGCRATVIQLDVRDPENVARLFEQVEQDLGVPDILVNDAGISGQGEVEELELESWDNTLKTNLSGPFSCSQQFIRLRRQAGGEAGSSTSPPSMRRFRRMGRRL